MAKRKGKYRDELRSSAFEFKSDIDDISRTTAGRPYKKTKFVFENFMFYAISA